MYKKDLEDIKEILTELGLEYRYFKWSTIPQAHRFATYHVPAESFDGSDECVEYCDYKVVVYIWFHDFMNEDDAALLESFEQDVRGAGRYKKQSGYDSERELLYSRYEFDFKAFYEE